jgi:predicted acyltransferase
MGIDGIRCIGVLQRIAIAFLCSGLAFVFLGTRARAVLCGALLLGYWALITFVPVPGVGAGDFAEGRNLANWIDRNFLAGFKWDGDHDPEGLLSTLPAVATGLLGVFAGQWMKRDDRAPGQKVAGLFWAGVVMVVAGWLWHLQFPVIKKLWTSSYVLVAGGYSCLLLGAFHWLIDIRGQRKWAAPFVWIGMNPITLYLSHEVIDYKKVSTYIAGGPVAESFGHWGGVWLALVILGLSVLLAWFMFSRRLFLRV